MTKKVTSKENGDYIHVLYNRIVGMFFFFKMCILLSKKNQYFLEAQPHYNPAKDLKIHDSSMFVI